jgi:hypothetical protein
LNKPRLPIVHRNIQNITSLLERKDTTYMMENAVYEIKKAFKMPTIKPKQNKERGKEQPAP